MEETEGKFAPLTEEFQILEKYEVTVEEAVRFYSCQFYINLHY